MVLSRFTQIGLPLRAWVKRIKPKQENFMKKLIIAFKISIHMPLGQYKES
jgi:hypothetical protein